MDIDQILQLIGSFSKYLYVLGLIAMIVAMVLKHRFAYRGLQRLKEKDSQIDRLMSYIGNVETEDDRPHTKK